MITRDYMEKATAAPVAPDLDSSELILHRLSVHADSDRREIMYGLRLLVANHIEPDGESSTAAPTDTQYNDVQNKRWEEGKHNQISTNTAIQVKSLVFDDPDISWSGCTGPSPETTALVRREYYLDCWRKGNWKHLYRSKLHDLITTGEANIRVGVRDGRPFMEYLDGMAVTWDRSTKDPAKKRFVFVDIPMPISEALRLYPALKGKVREPNEKGVGGEAIVVITCYWSKTTAAVFYKKQMLDGPKKNPYPRIPVNLTTMLHLPSVKYAQSMVEGQVGSHRLDLRLQRSIGSTALRSGAVGVFSGSGWNEDAITDFESGEEGVSLRSSSPEARFNFANGPEIPASTLKALEMVRQNMNAESGVNDFMRSQTDTQVDFASQLAYIASESGIQGKFTAQVHEEGIKEDARLYMECAAIYEDGPLTLPLRNSEVTFDDSLPIKPLLGTDGEISIKPMQYQSSAQKLQQTMILGNVLAIGNELAGPLQLMFYEQCLQASDIDNKEEVLDQLRQQAAMNQQMQMAQQQMQMAQMQGMGQPPAPGQGQPPVAA